MCARRWLIFREWNSFVYSKTFSLKLFCTNWNLVFFGFCFHSSELLPYRCRHSRIVYVIIRLFCVQFVVVLMWSKWINIKKFLLFRYPFFHYTNLGPRKNKTNKINTKRTPNSATIMRSLCELGMFSILSIWTNCSHEYRWPCLTQ